MIAVVIHSAKDLRLEEHQAKALGPNDVSVRLSRGGICGSDLHYYNHGGFGTVRVREPMILGHEVSGVVQAIGDNVSGFQEGDLVAVSPSRPCWTCVQCRRGLPNHCENMRFYGSAMPWPHIQGAFRQVLVADGAQCVRANGLNAAHAAMAEPLSVCLHAAKQAGDMLGKTVLITGCGPIGALMVLVARRAGATRIVVTDLVDHPLQLARDIGADQAINAVTGEEVIETFQNGKGTFDVHFECSGAAAALASGVACLRPGGVLVQLGLGGDMTTPMQTLTAKEISLKGSFRFHAELEIAVRQMQSGLIDVSPLLTHTFELKEAVDAFETANDRTCAMKVQIDFN